MVAQAVLELKQEDGQDLHVIGSPQLVQTLAEHNLVDEYRLMIDPLIMGSANDSSATAPHQSRFGL